VHNRIDGYQKGGILVENAGASAKIFGNTVTGAGPTGVIAQNGIQVSDGATARVRHNQVSGNSYTNTAVDGFEAAGILLFDAAAGVEVEGNAVFANEDGIFSFGTSRSEIEHNFIYRNDLAGIVLLGPGEARNEVTGNVVTGNSIGIYV